MSAPCGCKSLTCWLDISLHRLGVRVPWVCNRHQRKAPK